MEIKPLFLTLVLVTWLRYVTVVSLFSNCIIYLVEYLRAKKDIIFLTYFLSILALQVTLCLFRLALRGYLVVLLPRSLHLHSWMLHSLRFFALHWHSQSLFSFEICGCFAPEGFAFVSCSLSSCAFYVSAHKNFWNHFCISMDSKCSEMHRNAKKLYPLWSNTCFARRAKCKWRRVTSPTPCYSQGPKEVSMPIGPKLDAREIHTDSPPFIL